MNARELTDELLVGALGDLLDTDEPLPADAAVIREAAFALARPDATLADLLHDSAHDEPVLSGVRADDDTRSLSFASGATTVELEVQHDGTVIGRVEPAAATATLETGPDEAQPLSLDGLGRFLVTCDATRLRLVVHSGGADVVTPWVFR